MFISTIYSLTLSESFSMLTKYIDSKLSIDRREKAIHEMNEPPCYIECNSYW